MAFKPPQLLIDELLERKIVTPEIVAQIQAESAQGEKDFGALCIEKGIIADADLLKVKVEIYKLPVVQAVDVEIDSALSEKVSDATIKYYQILPYARQNGVLKVVLLDPENIDALQALKFIASEQNLTLEKYLVTYRDFSTLSNN